MVTVITGLYTLHNGPFALLTGNRERVYKAKLNPTRSIRIYPHENPCSLKTRYKEKQDKLAKRDVLRSADLQGELG
jgi:hypothetical protein